MKAEGTYVLGRYRPRGAIYTYIYTVNILLRDREARL